MEPRWFGHDFLIGKTCPYVGFRVLYPQIVWPWKQHGAMEIGWSEWTQLDYLHILGPCIKIQRKTPSEPKLSSAVKSQRSPSPSLSSSLSSSSSSSSSSPTSSSCL
jgi:hypothetical protein